MLIISRHKIIEENIIREKIMAKIVHEFKTPLNSIIGVIGSIEASIELEENESSKTTMKHLETARNLSNYVVFLIGDIIHFTTIKRMDDIQISMEKIKLKEVANFGFDILQSLLRCNKAKSEAIEPVLEFEDNIESLSIKADDVRLKQIILNFVSNAVKFTKAGSIKLKCSLIPEKECVILSIIDTGVGISENEKDKLFNDFKMIKTETVNNAMGSGLGLSICKSLSSRMKMEISTRSILGQGSEFSIAVPIIPDSHLNQLIEHIRNEQLDGSLGIKNEIVRQKLELSNYHQLSEKSHHSELDMVNESILHELKFNDTNNSKSCRSSSKTLKLGHEFLFPKYNFANLNNNFGDNIRSSTLQDFSIHSKFLSQKSLENVEINLKKKGKILIVDDNHFILETMKTIIKKILIEAGSDMEIIIGYDGYDIIQNIIQDQSKGNEIKCILTDENMEYINGSEAIKMIRNFEKNQKTKFVNIISVTANEDSEYTNHILNAGAQMVLGKPISKSVIKNLLNTLEII